MEKVVVTGGAGFIGSHIVDALIEAGYDAHIVDTLEGGNRRNINPRATLHTIDIRDYDGMRNVCEGATFVFHLAALPRVQFSIENPDITHDINVTGTLAVLRAAKDAGVARVIYSASSAAYGDQPEMLLTEDMPAAPKSPYGLQKYLGELYCRLFSEVYNLPTVSLRYFNVYGPRMNPEGAYPLVIGYFLKLRREDKPLTITGDGTQTRDFVHVHDVVRANLHAATNAPGHGEVINIGGGKNVSVNHVAQLIGGPTIHIAPRLEPHDTLADITRAREILDWSPTIFIEDGIRELLL